MTGRFSGTLSGCGLAIVLLLSSQAARMDAARLDQRLPDSLSENENETHSAHLSDDGHSAESQVAGVAPQWTFIFCRHAESLQNLLKKQLAKGKVWRIFSGGMGFDEPLSETGKLQAQAAHEFMAKEFKDLDHLRLMTSTLQRAIETADTIFEPTTASPWPQRDADLNEKTFDEHTHLLSGKKLFKARVKQFVLRMLKLPEKDRPEAIVGHSQWFRLLRSFGIEAGTADVLRDGLKLIKNTECRRVVTEETVPGEAFSFTDSRIYTPAN